MPQALPVPIIDGDDAGAEIVSRLRLLDTDRQRRRDVKRALLEDVRAWLDVDAERGRLALAD